MPIIQRHQFIGVRVEKILILIITVKLHIFFSRIPVQAYHYRKITLKKIRDYDVTGQEINAEIAEYLKNVSIPVIRCKNFKQHQIIFNYIEKQSTHKP